MSAVGVTRHLVTTADERTWKSDQPVLFLGEWCRLYNRRHIWSAMDAIVCEPYGLLPGQKERDLAYVESVSSRLVRDLGEDLNSRHRTGHGPRYWNILIGHWVRRFVATVFHRFAVVERALNRGDARTTTILSDANYRLATTDSLGFVRAANDDTWNHVLCSRIVGFLGIESAETHAVSLSAAGGFRYERPTPRVATSGRATWFTQATAALSRQLSGASDAVIAGTYLPQAQAAQLHLMLGQCPRAWSQSAVPDAAVDAIQRAEIRLSQTSAGFEQFISSLIVEALPTCYLEGYESLLDQVRSQRWPDQPRFIFTSNRFDFDEVFKAWTGAMVEQGVPYFVGQHGNNYGTSLQNRYSPEMTTCDRFVSWGWVNESPRDVPAFVFKLAGRKPLQVKPSGGLLLIQVHPPHRITPWDSYFEFALYQEEQFRFLETLPTAIRDEATVRLHAEHRNHRWADDERWRDYRPELRLDPGVIDISRLIEQSRLVVHSYDSTGMLETLAMNIPTVCFWRGGFSHLIPSARPHYEWLRDAGIFFDTPEQAAEHVSLHWDSLGEWWATAKVQEGRQRFCERYAKAEKHPVTKLRTLLLDACAGSAARSVQ